MSAGPVAGAAFGKLGEASGKQSPQPEVLLAIVADNYYLGRTPAGEPFAVDLRRAPSVAIPLKGRDGLRQRLAVDMFTLTGKAPSQEALSTVAAMAEGICAQQPHPFAAAYRVAAGGGGIVLDLGRADGTAAVVTPSGWELTGRPPSRPRPRINSGAVHGQPAHAPADPVGQAIRGRDQQLGPDSRLDVDLLGR
jgi:hypothetical protein